MRNVVRTALALVLALGLLTTSGCIIIRREPVDEPESSRTQRKTESVPLGTADEARVQISMGAGELAVEGADLDDDVLRGTFVFAPAELEPEVTSEEQAGAVDVKVSHPDIRDFGFWGRNLASEWSVEVSTEVPTELDVAMGAGDGNLDLQGIDLSDLLVEMGAGDLMLDLSGPRPRDLDARITTGAGRVEVRLPSDVGVRVSGRTDGVGEWVYEEFTVDGQYLVNDAYGESDTTIELDIQRGIGEVELVLVD